MKTCFLKYWMFGFGILGFASYIFSWFEKDSTRALIYSNHGFVLMILASVLAAIEKRFSDIEKKFPDGKS